MSVKTREKHFWKKYFGLRGAGKVPEAIDSFGGPHAEITDEDLFFLTLQVKRIDHLCLSGSYVTHTGVAHLSKLHHIKKLDLKDLPITDECLFHLKNIKGLKILNVRHTNLTYEGLKGFLSGYESLQELYISSGIMEKHEVQKLRKNYPFVTIIF